MADDNVKGESITVEDEEEGEIIPNKSENYNLQDEDETEKFPDTNDSPRLSENVSIIQTNNEKILHLNAQGFYLIPLPKGKSNIWQFFGLCSRDGVTILPEHSSTVFCLVSGCPSPVLGYCGNTTNLYGHLERKHPDIELPKKRNEKVHDVSFGPNGIRKTVAKKMLVQPGATESNTQVHHFRKRGRPISKTDFVKRFASAYHSDNEYEDIEPDTQSFESEFEVLNARVYDKLPAIQYPRDSDRRETEKFEVIPIASPSVLKGSDKIYDHLVNFLSTDLTGYSLLRKKGFQKLLTDLNPELTENFSVNFDILKNMIKAKFFKCQADFKLSLIQQQTEVFAMTLEEWLSSGYSLFLEVRIVYVDANWKIKTQFLGNLPFNASQTGKQIAEKIKLLLSEMNINAFNGNKEIVSNTSTVFMSEKLKKAFSRLPNIPSFEEVISCALKDALSEGVCGNLLEKLNFDVETIRTFEIHQTVTTRLDEILKQELSQNSNDPSVSNFGLKLTTKQWIEVKELRCELEKVANFVSLLNDMEHIPLSMLIPLRYKFLEVIKQYPSDSSLSASFKKIITTQIESYYSDSSTILLLEKSMWLDPRFKNLALMNNKENVEQEVLEEVLSLKPRMSKDTNSSLLNSRNTLDNLFQSLPLQMESTQLGQNDKAEEEVLQYSRCASMDFKRDPLEFWHTMSSIWPNLSEIAKKYLTIPIKTSNGTHRKDRNLLEPQEINYLPFLHSFCNNLT